MASSPPFSNAQPNAHIDHRRYPRVDISVPGRFMTPDGAEHICTIHNFSFGGLGFTSPEKVTVGEHIIAYIDNLGRFEGPVARLFENGFAIQMELKGSRLERIAQKVDLQAARKEEEEKSDNRTADTARATQIGMGSQLTLEDGRSGPCKIIDISLTGVKLITHMRPPLDARVTIGTMRGRVEAHTAEGILIAFDETGHRKAG